MNEQSTAIDRWEVACLSAGTAITPADVPPDALWIPACSPGTALDAWRTAGMWDLDASLDPDAHDWWFRAVAVPPIVGPAVLRFHGIATIAEAWVDGCSVLTSDNMFVAHDVAVTVQPGMQIVVVCRSLTAELAHRRPRGRWRTALVREQRLRWVRTTLLGRMPGWTPSIAPVGLWRPVELLAADTPRFDRSHLGAALDGADGLVSLHGTLYGIDPTAPVEVRVGGEMLTTNLGTVDGVVSVAASGRLHEPPLWFPHSAGEPVLLPLEIVVGSGASSVVLTVARIGFRRVAARHDDGGFTLIWNDIELFCRGVCWTPPDPVALYSSADTLRRALEQVVAAGMNMVRLTGTLVYEQDEFYDLCDELGVLVWQDLMFANFDYPADDVAFAASCTTEIEQLCCRLQGHPALAVVSGGSEIDQQAAMLGLAPTKRINDWAEHSIRDLVGARLTAVPYVIGSPSGGDIPFSVDTGISHYYGVGAYRRSLDDPRRADVRFAAESLAFANVPCREAVDELLVDGDRPGHSPRWKQRVPRDRGAGWDFEDVRDHYVRELFGVDPVEVRWSDPERYLDLGRAAVHAAVETTISELRRPGSRCAGVLVMMLRDLWLGAGWGVIDAQGRPKSAYHALARTCAPLAVLVTDEGLNGLVAHVMNDAPTAFAGTLGVRVHQANGAVLVSAEQTVEVAARGSHAQSLDSMLPGFRDLARAYQFGPSVNDVIHVVLSDAAGVERSQLCVLPGGRRRAVEPTVGLTASGRLDEDGSMLVTVSTERFAQFVSIDVAGGIADHDCFDLAPGASRRVVVHPTECGFGSLRSVHALNVAAPATITMER